MNWQERAKELSEAHWEYHLIINDLTYMRKDDNHCLSGFHSWYKAIFQHGYKHAIEDIQQGKITVFRGEE